MHVHHSMFVRWVLVESFFASIQCMNITVNAQQMNIVGRRGQHGFTVCTTTHRHIHHQTRWAVVVEILGRWGPMRVGFDGQYWYVVKCRCGCCRSAHGSLGIAQRSLNRRPWCDTCQRSHPPTRNRRRSNSRSSRVASFVPSFNGNLQKIFEQIVLVHTVHVHHTNVGRYHHGLDCVNEGGGRCRTKQAPVIILFRDDGYHPLAPFFMLLVVLHQSTAQIINIFCSIRMVVAVRPQNLWGIQCH